MPKHSVKQEVLKSGMFKAILGQEHTKRQIQSALLMDRHIIIVGPPGVGKTTISKSVAEVLPEIELNDCGFNCDPKHPLCPACKKGKGTKKKLSGPERFVRVQGSPDLTAEDLLGDIDPMKALKYGPMSIEAFTPGKIFHANQGVLFFDEVNRCPPKLQNALLQVLQEGKATIGSFEVEFPANFIFIGTMNPEDQSTDPLSHVFLDRFDFVYMSYPKSDKIEEDIVKENGKQFEVTFPDELLQSAITFVRILRFDKNLAVHPSVRASIGLYERSQSNCYLDGRKSVTAKDITEAVVSVIAHRIELKPSVKYVQSPETYIEKKFEEFLHGAEGMKEAGDAP